MSQTFDTGFCPVCMSEGGTHKSDCETRQEATSREESFETRPFSDDDISDQARRIARDTHPEMLYQTISELQELAVDPDGFGLEHLRAYYPKRDWKPAQFEKLLSEIIVALGDRAPMYFGTEEERNTDFKEREDRRNARESDERIRKIDSILYGLRSRVKAAESIAGLHGMYLKRRLDNLAEITAEVRKAEESLSSSQATIDGTGFFAGLFSGNKLEAARNDVRARTEEIRQLNKRMKSVEAALVPLQKSFDEADANLKAETIAYETNAEARALEEELRVLRAR